MAEMERGLSTGGVDIGPIGHLGGHLPGLNAITSLAVNIGPAMMGASLARKAGKDYNDQAVAKAHTVGTDNGRRRPRGPGPNRKSVQWWPSSVKEAHDSTRRSLYGSGAT